MKITKTLEKLAPITSIGSRLLLSSAIFFIIANHLGAESYGVFAIHLTYGILIGQITDFGAQNKVIREISSSANTWQESVVYSITNKIITIPASIIIAAITIKLSGSNTSASIIIPLAIYYITNSILEIFFSAARASGRILLESIIIFTANIITAILSLSSLFNSGIESFSEALALSRTLILVAPVVVIALSLHRNKSIRITAKNAVSYAKESVSYGIDAIATNTTSTAQMVIISITSSPVVLGQYQLLQRLVQGYSTLSMISAQKFMPLLGRSINNEKYNSTRKSYIRTNAIISLIPITTLAAAMLESVHGILGITKETAILLPVLSIIISIKYASAVEGVSLIIEGGATSKAKISTVHGLAILSLTAVLTNISPSLKTLIAIDLATSMAILFLYNKARKNAQTKNQSS